MKHTLTVAILIILFIPVSFVEAADFTVRPFLFDKSLEARSIVEDTVVLTNETPRKLVIYASVNEIDIGTNGEVKKFISPVMTDRKTNVTSWIEITRGRIELEPGESEEIPVTFRVHPFAEPGEYHAYIGFYAASKRYEAERAVMRGDALGIVVKINIDDKREEFLRISGLLIDRFITQKDQREIDIELENLGDVPQTPTGEIIFFNSTGQEVNAITVNEDDVTIAPGETKTITVPLPFTNETGRYKANVSLRYGAQRAAIYDTTQFYLVPFHVMALIVIGILFFSFLVALLVRRMLVEDDDEDDVEGTELPFYVRDGHDPKPQDHDIDLSKKTE